MKISRGIFLIASPTLADPNFRRTVVLLCDHDEEGSLGLVLNRPMDVPVSKVVPSLEAQGQRSGLIHIGGPVDANRLMALRRGSHPGDELREIGDDLYLVADLDRTIEGFTASRRDPEDYRFDLGYAGWGKKQLAGEIRQNAWIVRPANSSLVFQVPAASLWAAALKEMGGGYSLYAEMPLDPTMN
ncbi:MAG: YqgE/AlgH family protein [Planctomycetota bacterium]